MISPSESMFVFAAVLFVFSVIISLAPVMETSGVGLLGAISSLCFLSFASLADPQGLMSSAGIVGSLLLIGIGIFTLDSWNPVERHRAKVAARERFPLASTKQIKAVVAKVLSGTSVSMFSLLDGRILHNRGQHSTWCAEDGRWHPASTRAANYYEVEQQLIAKVIALAPSRLPQEAMRELCVNLYFNWTIADHEFDGGLLTVILARRREKKMKQYTCIQS